MKKKAATMRLPGWKVIEELSRRQQHEWGCTCMQRNGMVQQISLCSENFVAYSTRVKSQQVRPILKFLKIV
ncbi:unnamed protein product, partial [Iphiclides podalirius]